MSDKIKILLVEDDLDDIELLEEALKVNEVNYSLDVVMEGDKVLPYMSNANALPAVIVLDFNLPRLHGKEILRILKTSPDFDVVPVVVLTTSAAKEDIEYALKTGAAHFITKPTSMHGFADAVATIVSAAK